MKLRQMQQKAQKSPKATKAKDTTSCMREPKANWQKQQSSKSETERGSTKQKMSKTHRNTEHNKAKQRPPIATADERFNAAFFQVLCRSLMSRHSLQAETCRTRAYTASPETWTAPSKLCAAASTSAHECLVMFSGCMPLYLRHKERVITYVRNVWCLHTCTIMYIHLCARLRNKERY